MKIVVARRTAIAAVLIASAASLGFIAWTLATGDFERMASAVVRLDQVITQNYLAALASFALVSLLVQLIYVPMGTVLNLAGGFLFGALTSVSIYYAAQLIAAPLVFTAVRHGFGDGAAQLLQRRLSGRFQRLLELARKEGVAAVVAMRLSPVFTSAVTPSLAALVGIPLGALMLGSMLASWVRPLLSASVGALGREMQGVTSLTQLQDRIDPWPLTLLAAGGVALLAGRLWMRSRRLDR